MDVFDRMKPSEIDAFWTLRAALPRMAEEDRVKLFDAVREGYCSDCGKAEGKYPCRCTDDD